MRQREPILLVLIAFLLVACATAPRNVSESIGQGYATLTTVAHDVQAAYSTELINGSQAQKLKLDLQNAKNTLDLASKLYTEGDAAGAQGRAQQVHLILQAVIAALAEAEKHGT